MRFTDEPRLTENKLVVVFVVLILSSSVDATAGVYRMLAKPFTSVDSVLTSVEAVLSWSLTKRDCESRAWTVKLRASPEMGEYTYVAVAVEETFPTMVKPGSRSLSELLLSTAVRPRVMTALTKFCSASEFWNVLKTPPVAMMAASTAGSLGSDSGERKPNETRMPRPWARLSCSTRSVAEESWPSVRTTMPVTPAVVAWPLVSSSIAVSRPPAMYVPPLESIRSKEGPALAGSPSG